LRTHDLQGDPPDELEVNDVWLVKGLFFLLLLIALAYFFMENSGRTVDITIAGRDYLDISIFWILILAFLLGFTTSSLVAAVREIRFHRQIHKLKGHIRAKEQEIADLRTLPLRDMPADGLIEESGRD